MAKILIVDDEPNQRSIMVDILTSSNHCAHDTASVDHALNWLRKGEYDVVLTDLKMPGKSGLCLVEEVSNLTCPPEIVVITAYGSIDTAVKAIRLGAYDYLSKPLGREEVLFTVERAAEKYALRRESRDLRCQLIGEITSALVAESLTMQDVLKTIEKVGPTSSTVLIHGETGTRKGMCRKTYSPPLAAVASSFAGHQLRRPSGSIA